MKHTKLLLGLAVLALLVSFAATVQAFQEPPLSKLALQSEEMPVSAQIASRGDFKPASLAQVGAYGMVDAQGQQLVSNYLRGYEIQAFAPSQAVFIANYVYEFKSTDLAKTEYANWQQKLSAHSPVGKVESLKSKSGLLGERAVFISSETGTPLYWFVAQKGRFLWFVMVDSGFSSEAMDRGFESADAQAGKQVFDQLVNTILSR
jgi:hypothetical protein